jgi:hypothetical protein
MAVFVANAFISQANTQTMHIKSIMHNILVMISKNLYTLAEFEPGSCVPEADAMSTEARRLGCHSKQTFRHLESPMYLHKLARFLKMLKLCFLPWRRGQGVHLQNRGSRIRFPPGKGSRSLYLAVVKT